MSTPRTRRDLRERVGAAAPTASPSARARRARGAGRMLGDVLLWIAALGGVVCIALVILAATAQITLILFRTGSMSPAIPAGSVAVVQRVAASDVEVGDVVTVDREGELPVTHRVTSVSTGSSVSSVSSVSSGGAADQRVLTLRGDANAADDPFPYTVTSVRRVLFSVPGTATVIVALGNPLVLGGLTAAATALVVWAFWPRASSRRIDRRRPDGGAG